MKFLKIKVLFYFIATVIVALVTITLGASMAVSRLGSWWWSIFEARYLPLAGIFAGWAFSHLVYGWRRRVGLIIGLGYAVTMAWYLFALTSSPLNMFHLFLSSLTVYNLVEVVLVDKFILNFRKLVAMEEAEQKEQDPARN